MLGQESYEYCTHQLVDSGLRNADKGRPLL
jgi:hypothetical protein